MTDKKIEILYDHYKDTHAEIRKHIGQRERLFFFSVLAIGCLYLQVLQPDIVGKIFNGYMLDKFKVTLDLQLYAIQNTILFFLFVLVLKYFQVSVLIERLYIYIHNLENRLNKAIGKNMVAREGVGYLTNYPNLSWLANVIYKYGVPILIIVVCAHKVWIAAFNNPAPGQLIGVLISAGITTVTLFYIYDVWKIGNKT